MTKEEIFELCKSSKNGVILREKNFKKNFPDVYVEVLSFSNYDISFIQKLYNYFYEIKTIPITNCGKEKPFRNFKYGYNDFCSQNCHCLIEYSNKKRAETNIQKFGVEYPTKNETIKRKISNTKLNYSDDKKENISNKQRATLKLHYANYKEVISKRIENLYGVKNISQIKTVSKKAKKSNIDRHGGVGFSSKKINEKIKQTNLARYGVENPTQSEIIKEKTKQNNLKKYGVEYFVQSNVFKEKYKNSCMKKYGVDNSSKNPEIKKKISDKNKIYHARKTILKHPDIIEIKDNTFIVKCDDDCVCGGSFEIPKNIYFQRKSVGVKLCTIKNPIQQKLEMENGFCLYIRNIYNGEIIVHDRTILNGKEIDIYLPELKLGFEFNGDYWHSNPLFSKYTESGVSTHWEETQLKEYNANLKGVSLFIIWEEEWLNHTEEIKLYIKSIIDNKTETKTAYYKLKNFLQNIQTNFIENEFGLFETDSVIIKYANGFYCNKKTIDKDWFVVSDKRVIYAYDFEINDNTKFEIIKSIIKHAVGETENKIYARKCKLREITNKESRAFLDKNSIFGHRNATITIGLFFKNELVMVYSFGYNFYGKTSNIEVIRVCTKKNTIVVGGSSKCLKYFLTNYKETILDRNLVFYVDKIHQDGSSLHGFKFVNHSFGFMNYWNFDYNDDKLCGKRHTAFNRMPSQHKKIKELEQANIITSILTIGVDKYIFCN